MPLGLLSLLALSLAPAPVRRSRPPEEPGRLPAAWINGVDCEREPEIQVHRYSETVWILRQSKCTQFEAPFLYLVLGRERGLLLDTGSRKTIPLRETIQEILQAQLRGPQLDTYELIVAHSHAHGDHLSGDEQMEELDVAEVLGWTFGAVISYYGFQDWPNDVVELDLGDRILDVIPTPGHDTMGITFYDRRTQLLLTGDHLYPGYLFIFFPSFFDDYQDSTQRLVDFAARNPITHILGGHIEMTSMPGVAFRYGEKMHPDEHVLELGVEHLLELNEALKAMGDEARYEVHDDFIIYPTYAGG